MTTTEWETCERYPCSKPECSGELRCAELRAEAEAKLAASGSEAAKYFELWNATLDEVLLQAKRHEAKLAALRAAIGALGPGKGGPR